MGGGQTFAQSATIYMPSKRACESRTRSIRKDPEYPRPPRTRRRLADSELAKGVGIPSDLPGCRRATGRDMSAPTMVSSRRAATQHDLPESRVVAWLKGPE